MNEEDKIVQEAVEEKHGKKKQNKRELVLVDGKPVVHIKVYSPFKIYFDDQAFSISAENDTGPFDILPGHHNFMTLLNSCELLIATATEPQKIKISRGVMHVKADQINVFLDV